MSQRQDKYIAQLLRANCKQVMATYRELRADGETAGQAMQTARGVVLLELAEARNLAHVEWEGETEVYDYGDIPEREQERLKKKLEREEAYVECYCVYVRDRSGAWDVVDSLGMCWIETQADRDRCVRDYLDLGEIKAALYRHRARDDFGEFRQRWVPGHYTTE